MYWLGLFALLVFLIFVLDPLVDTFIAESKFVRDEKLKARQLHEMKPKTGPALWTGKEHERVKELYEEMKKTGQV